MKEIDIVPSIAYGRVGPSRDIDVAASILAARPGIADVLITHCVPLDAAGEAFAAARDRASSWPIKVVVEPCTATSRDVRKLIPGHSLAYGLVSPDGPEHWPVVAAKGRRLAFEEPTFDVSDLAAITKPTLVLAADDDKVGVAHLASLYDVLPTAQLAIVPDTSHFLPFEKPALVAQLILDFLDHSSRSSTFMPARRPGPA